MQRSLTIFSVLAIFCIANAQLFIAVKDNARIEVHEVQTLPQDYVAYAVYKNEVNVDGFDKLTVFSNGEYSNEDQMFAYGMLHGYSMHTRIFEYRNNFLAHTFPNGVSKCIYSYLRQQLVYMRDLSVEGGWYNRQLGMTVAQFDGYVAGYQLRHPTGEKYLSQYDLMLVASEGDMYEVQPHCDEDLPNYTNCDQKCLDYLRDRSSCTVGMRKIKGDFFAFHNTWSYYASNLRVKVDLTLALSPVTFKTRYTSKPGYLFSKDDFYVIESSGLFVTETTNSVLDKSVLKNVSPHTVPTWARVMMASRMATTAKEWAETFAKHSSGTYASGWIVADMKLTKQDPLPSESVYLAEDAPGKVCVGPIADAIVERGNQWSSYNIPFFPECYEYMGYKEFSKTHPDYVYADAPRRKIADRELPKINTYDEFRAFSRYNEYKSDPVSGGDPSKSICSRYDLRDEHAAAFGCLDAKVTSADDTLNGQADIICGPTHSTADLPPFQWSTSAFKDEVHDGCPDVYDFPWIRISEE
ncbi:hypothetical protein PCE1_002721 [Barthelona sp. PCE]